METINTDSEEVKPKPGRGGRRAGAGRPFLELHQEKDRAVTRSITLTVEEWELLRSHSRSKSYSRAVAAALSLALFPAGIHPKDWLTVPDRFAGPGPVPARELTSKNQHQKDGPHR